MTTAGRQVMPSNSLRREDACPFFEPASFLRCLELHRTTLLSQPSIMATTTRAVGQSGRRYLIEHILQEKPGPLGRVYLASWVYYSTIAL
jgi:hypothetical protein